MAHGSFCELYSNTLKVTRIICSKADVVCPSYTIDSFVYLDPNNGNKKDGR